MKAREVVRLLLAEGWYEARSRGKGSHRLYFHPNRPGSVVVPGHGGRDLKPGTLSAILKQAGLK
jgi:predicted RNA binding protein YcfA (HicA-like mRNA interferase family)